MLSPEDLGHLGLSGFRSVKWESHLVRWARGPVDLREWNFSPLHFVDSVCSTSDPSEWIFELLDLIDWVIGIFYVFYWASEGLLRHGQCASCAFPVFFAICFVVLSRLQYWPLIWSALSSLLTTIVVAAGVFVCLFNLSCTWIRLNILIFVGFDYRDWDITDCTFTFRFLIIGLDFCFPDPRTHHDGLIWLWEPDAGSVYQMQIFISIFCSNSRKYLTSRAFEFCIAPWFWI